MRAQPQNQLVTKISLESLQFYANREWIETKDIVLLLADVNYTYIHLQCGRVILSSKTLKRFEAPLTSVGFYRVHKSAIINLAFMHTHPSPTEIVMQNGHTVKVSRRRNMNLQNTILN